MMFFMMAAGGDEKTEKATPKKRRDTRQKGQVLKSTEVNTAVMLVAMFAAINIWGRNIVEGLKEIFIRFTGVEYMQASALESGTLGKTMISVVVDTFVMIAPIFVVAVVAGIAVNVLQTGLLFTTEAIKPKLSNLNPLQGLKKMFSMRTIVELIKTLVKLTIVGWILYSAYMEKFNHMPQLLIQGLGESANFIFSTALSMAFQVSIALIIFAVADYAYQWWDFERNLMMTKQEIKDEFKQIEGDPKVKSQMRQRQRQAGMRRMMQNVPTADVVITNPTHYAIALKYDEHVNSAPIVVAKGKDFVARKIKEMAAEHNVEMIENRPLAQALYLTTDVGEPIQADLFGAVAEILAYVYKLKNKI